MKNLNNALKLTLFRLVLIPFIMVVFYVDFEISGYLSGAIFLIASVTDWLDGYIARKYNQTSQLGAFLDPVADKLLVVCVLVLLVHHYDAIWFNSMVIILILREVLVASLREWMATKQLRDKVAVSYWGKLKTTAQMLSLFLLLMNISANSGILFYTGVVLLVASVWLSLTSLYQYVLNARQSF